MKSQAGKPGYDKYGAKTAAKKRMDKSKSLEDKSKAEAKAKKDKRTKEVQIGEKQRRESRDRAIAGRASSRRQVDKIRRTMEGRDPNKARVAKVGLKASRGKVEDAGRITTSGDIKSIASKKGDGIKDSKGPKKSLLERAAALKKSKKKARKQGRIDKIKGRAEDAIKANKGNKAHRLARRAVRKKERAEGTRKSAVGTALTKVGRGAFGGLAALGGSDAAIRKAGTKGSFYTRKAHEKKKK